MLNFIASLLQIDTMITVLIGLAAFATVLTIAAPMLETDTLKARMKSVGQERDKLRAAQRAQMMSNDGKLRDMAQVGLSQQLVDALNLRRVFEAESSRDMLRQAGLRSERHLVTFLAARFAVPLVLAVLAFVYSSTLYADKVGPGGGGVGAGGVAVVG
jgi:tight adherence protein C